MRDQNKNKYILNQNFSDTLLFEYIEHETSFSFLFLKVLQHEKAVKFFRKKIRLFSENYLGHVLLPDSIEEDSDTIEFHYSSSLFRPCSVSEIMKLGMDPKDVISLGIGLAEALQDLNKLDLIHGEIFPNLICFPKDNNSQHNRGVQPICKLLYFGDLACNKTEGILPVIAPELLYVADQSKNEKTDLFALGVVLYKFLTGKYPFSDDSLLSSSYRRLIWNPQFNYKREDNMPQSLLAVISMLFAKEVQMRYKTAFGLLCDLHNLGEQQDLYSLNFVPGGVDAVPRMRFSGKLYDRNQLIQRLQKALKSNGKQRFSVMTILGEAGAGKTSLVDYMFNVLEENDVIFIRGKCEQGSRTLPYQVLIDLVNDFVRVIRIGNPIFETYLKKIDNELGDVGITLQSIFPGLCFNTDPFEKIFKLPPAESWNRLKSSFSRFINLITPEKSSVVLFLDDVQWIDRSSVDLFHHAFQEINPEGSLLILLAYRSNELNDNDYARKFMDSISEQGKNELLIHNLSAASIGQMLEDSGNFEEGSIYPLAELIRKKTGGNPFYVKLFVREIETDGILSFNYETQLWNYDLESLHKRKHTKNIIDFLINEMSTLEMHQKSFLLHAACIGSKFDLTLLAGVTTQSQVKLLMQAEELIRRNYIVSCGAGTYHFGVCQLLCVNFFSFKRFFPLISPQNRLIIVK